MQTMQQVTSKFGKAYQIVKTTTTVKSDLQKEFFNLATAELEECTRAQRVVTMPKGTVSRQGDWERWVNTYHPGWRFVEWKDDSAYDMIIEEDPALMVYTYLNPDDRTIYGRDTVQGQPQLDDDALRESDPDLWERISEWPEPLYTLVKDAMEYASTWNDKDEVFIDDLDIKEATFYYLRSRKIQRVLKPIDNLTTEQLESLAEYLVPAPVTVKLRPPRKAKQSELEEAAS